MNRTLTLAAAAVLAVSCAAAQSPGAVSLGDQGTKQALGSVLSATRLPSPQNNPSHVPSQVRVLTARDIERSGASTLQELLSRLPGFVMFDEIGNRFQQTLDLRGFNATPAPATVVLVDGARVNEPSLGTVNYQLIDLRDIERIEILPGPQTLYGKNAMGGVVSILTKRGRGREISVGVEVGSFDRLKVDASVSGAKDNVSYRFSGSRLTEAGYRRYSAARLHLFDARLDYKDQVKEASLSYRFGDDFLKQPGSLTASEISADRRQNVSAVEFDSLSHHVTLNGRRALGAGFTAAANASARKRLENTPINKGRSSRSRSRSDGTTSSYAVQLEHRADVGERAHFLAAGAEWTADKLDSDSSGSFGAFPFLSGSIVRERQAGLFIQETFELFPRLLAATAGLRLDRDSLESEDKDTPANNGARVYRRLSPRVGLTSSPSDRVTLFASLADSFRSPTPAEISALGPFGSSPRLNAVVARSFEIGARAHDEALGEATLSLFRTSLRDEIFPVYDPTAGFGQNRNLPRTRRQGLEATLAPRFGERAGASVGYSYTEATFESDFRLDKAPFPAVQNVRAGDMLPQVPRHRVAVEANVRLGAVTLSAQELCVGSQFLFGDEANDERRLGAYCVTGAKASYERGAVSLFVKADNLLDRRYETRGILGTDAAGTGLERYLMPAPGISFASGVRLRWR